MSDSEGGVVNDSLKHLLYIIKVDLTPEHVQEITSHSARHDKVPIENRKSTRSVVYASLHEEQERRGCTRDETLDHIKTDMGTAAFGMAMCILRCTLTMDADLGTHYAFSIFEMCQELRTGGAASTVRTYMYQWKNDKKVNTPVQSVQSLEEPKKRTFAQALTSHGVSVKSPIFKKPRTLAKFTANDFAVKPRSEKLEVSKKDFELVKDKQNALMEHLTNFVSNIKGELKEVKAKEETQSQRLDYLEGKLGELVEHFKTFVKDVNKRL